MVIGIICFVLGVYLGFGVCAIFSAASSADKSMQDKEETDNGS
jgi:hypothetical protein